MKKALIAIIGTVAAAGGGLSIVAARFEPTIVPNSYVGDLNLGGLSRDDAARKLRVWWETAKLEKLDLVNAKLQKKLSARTPGMLGLTLDDQATIDALPMTDLLQAVGEKVSTGAGDKKIFDIKYKLNGASLAPLEKEVRLSIGPKTPARVTFENGTIVRRPEISAYELDKEQLASATESAIRDHLDSIELPLKEAPKTMPDEELAKIKDVVAEYSTHFPSYQTSRNTNIRLAAAKLNGVVLMPGQQVSFNKTVGERTVKDGYKTAPVLKNGKHDTGIGGGICQVSTTLYNASVLSDLNIVRRQNHSIPSVYVPVGRDATVDWPSLDLVIANSYDFPIAISSTFQSGKITFRILGQKDFSKKVKIVTENHNVWDRGEQLVVDRSLPAGSRVVSDKGSRAHSIDVYKIIYKNGVEVKRSLLSHSIYNGSPRTISYNPAAKPVAPKPALPSTSGF